MRALHVLFYRPDPGDQWLNKLVVAVAPPYSHCDLQFDNGMATSIYQNESVYVERKNFSRLNYDRISIAVDEGEYDRVVSFCARAHRQEVAFDPVGMVLSSVPLVAPWAASRQPAGRTFCSRYILEALQATGRPEFLKHTPATTTPSGLHRILKEHGRDFIHISEKRMAQVLGGLGSNTMGR